jgi:hypothetical protein
MTSAFPDAIRSTPLMLTLDRIVDSRNFLSFSFSVDGLSFNTTYWYEGVDFGALRKTYGDQAINSVAFHVAAFEINKIASLKPDSVDFAQYDQYATDEFVALWQRIFDNVWAQWRYENDLSDYMHPDIARSQSGRLTTAALQRRNANNRILLFCGGGKDSLVAMKSLERGNFAFDSLSYSSSIYGTAQLQHALIRRLQQFSKPENCYRQWIFDDFLDSPVLSLRPEFGVKTLTAAETPSSIFSVIPLILAHGHSHIALGHERSADTGQVHWTKTGEDINHQWGKSYEAENLINSYIKRFLVSDFEYFSILKPIYDTLIFQMLQRDLSAVPATHSCNIRKPWCMRCPKCAYVWLGYMAFLPLEVVRKTFGPENLFDVPELQIIFRQLLGLENQLPFECIGQASESQLFFELCKHKGYDGSAMQMYRQCIGGIDIEAAMNKHLRIVWEGSNIPAHLRSFLDREWTDAIAKAREYIAQTMNS